MNPRIIACRPTGCYRLWLKYADGYSGIVDLGSVLELSHFRALRDPKMFNTARLDEEIGAVHWPQAGIHIDAEILRHDIFARGAGKVEAPGADPAFRKFMARATGAKNGPVGPRRPRSE